MCIINASVYTYAIIMEVLISINEACRLFFTLVVILCTTESNFYLDILLSIKLEDTIKAMPTKA